MAGYKRGEKYTATLANKVTIQVVKSNIYGEKTDAIVTLANSGLLFADLNEDGGGEKVVTESRAWVKEHGPVPTGMCAFTSGGKLRSKYMIHAVGPVWSQSKGPEFNCALLATTIVSVLETAEQLACKSISLSILASGFPTNLYSETLY